ncbi:flagellar hook-basal body protein [Bacillus sp. V3B]|uniref:flagellar hook-basal body protein n=1 Tax=Bacillus sp. V3B TaxID=2804915 RepID=UPI00210E6A18|nr:flagellar hook-basal body protein [Bacillus sp. V3B]MCQ6274642.1 flagellar hook-basal body protein [Bacillus sp. V3B]
MNRTMLTATNTLTQLQKQMDVMGHNIANVETTGFKRREATFTDLLVQQFNNQSDANSEIGRLTPNGIRQGSGAKLGQIQMVLTQGSLKTTNRELDTAFTAEGQLYRVLVDHPDGSEIQYTRDGAFYLSPLSPNEMMLVTSNGDSVLDENNNPIYINGQVKEYQITETGSMVIQMDDGQQQTINLGVTLANKPQFLEQEGNNRLSLPEDVGGEDVVTDLDGALRNQISIQQGALEQSNVELSKEMTDLISAQRSYQFQSRSINLADQMMGLINGIR